MSHLPGGAASELRGGVTQRWQEIDPLLPAPEPLPAGCGQQFAVARAGGEIQAAGSCEHWEGEPNSLELTWGAARRFQLAVHVAGPGVAGALDSVLSQWEEHLSGQPAAGAADTAAVVTWPSRDIDGAAVLLRHGFAPLAVIAAKVAQRELESTGDGHGAASGPTGLHVRRAGPGDLDVIVELGLEVVRFDAHFGGVTERPWTRPALTAELAVLLDEPRPWVWVAERDGAAIGMLAAERPEHARWIAPLSRLAPVSYLLLMGVRAGERARGAGAALSAQLNREVRTAGVPVTLLHYAQVNPLSAPFWSQQGYRPLWTCWEARPASRSA